MINQTAVPMDQSLQQLGDKVLPFFKDAKSQLSEAESRAKALVKQNPLAVLLGALGIGYLLGKLVSR